MTSGAHLIWRESLDAAIAASPYLCFLGVRTETAAGTVALVLPRDERHIGDGGRGSIHGGVLASFAEAAARLHLVALGAASAVEPVDVTIDFLREATIVDTHATVDVVRVGRRFATVRVDLRQGDHRRPVAAAQASFRLHHENPTDAA
jgi:uncharacterized protein (TIGR00369 family)